MSKINTSGAARTDFAARNASMAARPSRGVDICHYETVRDWRTLASEVDFIILKATQGHALSSSSYMFRDSSWEAYANACIKHKIPFGAYHFFTAESVAAAIREADFFCDMLEPYKKHIIYAVCDAEAYGGNRYIMGISRAELTARINAFCAEVTRRGYRAAHYTNTDHIRSKINLESIPYPVWQAHYPMPGRQISLSARLESKTSPEGDVSAYRPTTPNLIAWQYSEKGRISSIREEVDLNEGYFPTLVALYKLQLYGVINSPAYWEARAERVQYLPTLIERCASRVIGIPNDGMGGRKRTASEGIDALAEVGIIDTAGYWEQHKNDIPQLDELLKALGGARYKKSPEA